MKAYTVISKDKEVYVTVWASCHYVASSVVKDILKLCGHQEDLLVCVIPGHQNQWPIDFK
jgi:hypothetical protein